MKITKFPLSVDILIIPVKDNSEIPDGELSAIVCNRDIKVAFVEISTLEVIRLDDLTNGTFDSCRRVNDRRSELTDPKFSSVR